MSGHEQRASRLTLAEEIWQREVNIHGPIIILPMLVTGMYYLRNGLSEDQENRLLLHAYKEAVHKMYQSFNDAISILNQIADHSMVADPPVTAGQ